MKNNRLEAITPIDGRYSEMTNCLKEFFSEYAYIKYRYNIEIDWLKYLMDILKISNREIVNDNFSLKDAKGIKKIEKKTNHDVKAIEYYLRKKLRENNLGHLEYLVHFGLTSEDVNNIAVSKMVQDFMREILI